MSYPWNPWPPEVDTDVPPTPSTIPYIPNNPNDWPIPPPTNVQQALDTLATEVTALAFRFLIGFELSWISASKVQIEAGVARSITGTRNFVTGVQAQIDLTTTGPLGLDVGALAAATPYAVWCLSGAGGTTYVASKSFTYAGVVLPAGYDADGRRVGSFMTDPSLAQVNYCVQSGSGNTRTLTQTFPNYDNALVLDGGKAAVATAVSAAAFVPPSATEITCLFFLYVAGGGLPLTVVSYWGADDPGATMDSGNFLDTHRLAVDQSPSLSAIQTLSAAKTFAYYTTTAAFTGGFQAYLTAYTETV